MVKIKLNISNSLTRIIYSLYILLFSYLLLCFFLYQNFIPHYSYVFIGLVISIPLGIIVLYEISLLFRRLSNKKVFSILICACLIYKLVWILLFRIMPEVDYKTFFNTAVALSNNFYDRDPYVALFPHIMGYSLFLSVFFKTIGVHYLLPPLLNVILTTASVALLYYICDKLLSRQSAIIACILLIFLPSQTVYNMLALSEPLYSTELLLVCAMLVYVRRKISSTTIKSLIIYSVVISIIVELLDSTRPLGIIILIAISIWFLFIDNSADESDIKRNTVMKRLLFISMIIVTFAFFSLMTKQYLALRLGQMPASIPGYSIYTGFNPSSNGAWNTDDSRLLSHYSNTEGFSAVEAQQQMFKEAIIRIRNGNIDFRKLFHNKFILFLGNDSDAVNYTAEVFAHPVRLSIACNIYYYFLISASIPGAFMAAKRKNKSALVTICLYAIGLIMAQMLFEIAGRYHYSITLAIIIFAAYGVGDFLLPKLDVFIKKYRTTN